MHIVISHINSYHSIVTYIKNKNSGGGVVLYYMNCYVTDSSNGLPYNVTFICCDISYFM